MKKTLPRFLTYSLLFLLLFSALSGCGANTPAVTTVQTPAVTTVATTGYDPNATMPPVTIGFSTGGSSADSGDATAPTGTVPVVTNPTDQTSDTTEPSETTAESTDASTPPETTATEPVTEPQITMFDESSAAELVGAEEVNGTVVLRYTISYPVFQSNDGSSADALNAAVAAAAAKFETYAKETLLPLAKQAQKLGDSMLPFSFSVDYDVAVSSGTAVSVVFTQTEHTGESREAYARSACVFSLQSNAVMGLSDMFTGGAAAYTQTIYNAVFAKIAASPDAYYADYENLAQFFDLAEHWYLSKKGVVIFFNPFEIAGYDKGIVEFTLPYGEYSDQLKINPLYIG